MSRTSWFTGLVKWVIGQPPPTSTSAQGNILKVGDLQVTAEEHRLVPPWVGGVALVGGLVLIGVGVRGRRGA